MIFLPIDMPIEAIHEEASMRFTIHKYYPHQMEKIIGLIQRANFFYLNKKKHERYSKKPFIHSDRLRQISGYYLEYLAALYNLDLLEIDNSYSTLELNPDIEPFPRAYYFTPICGKKLFFQDINNTSLHSFNYNENFIYKSMYLCENLLSKFLAFLKFNTDDILNEIDQLYNNETHGRIVSITNKKKIFNGQTFTHRKIKLKKSFRRYYSSLYATHILKNKDFYFYRSLTNHRLYHPLANYPKKFRKHFTICGQKLVSIDLSNSQPFLSLILFDSNFWAGNSSSTSSKINIDSIGMKNCFTVSMNYFLNENTFPNLEKFTDLVKQDKLYSHLAVQSGLNPNVKKQRDKIKKAMYGIMFSKAKPIEEVNPVSKRGKFIKAFPDIYTFWSEIKDPNNQDYDIKLNPAKNKVQKAHALFPIMLQRIEAFLFLDVIAPYILKYHPNVPLIPIHDCLATTEENKELVWNIVEKLITEYTGHIPNLKYENWF